MPTVILEYRPPLLTVEARGAPLARVLRDIGARVGFTVVDDGQEHMTASDLSIQDASVDEALRRLLRGVNHAVIYSGGASAPYDRGSTRIAQIVLLGQPGSILSAADLEPGRTGRDGVTAEGGSEPLAPISSREMPPADPLRESSVAGGSAHEDPATDSDLEPVTVERLLANAAAAALPADRGGAASNEGANGLAAPEDLEAALAETTRRAQQNLTALVEALAAATKSLVSSPGPGGR